MTDIVIELKDGRIIHVFRDDRKNIIRFVSERKSEGEFAYPAPTSALRLMWEARKLERLRY
jgi:hypothetical protein